MSAKAGPARYTPAEVRPFESHKKLDGVGIFVGRLVAWLLMPLVAVLTLIYLPFILMSSNEFPIWRQKRPGFRGRDLLAPKFSTMNVDKQGVLRETWFGKLVRPVGLDEILQIYIIAKGEMQWFGPRPFLRKHINEEYIQAVLYYTKPGFFNSRSIATGIGNQALQGGQVSISQIIEFDQNDLRNWSFGYAARLFSRTLLAILRIH